MIVPENPEIGDRIIKATNSQTAIPSTQLRATEKIHRDIEDFLKSAGLYYDRRKNFYKNEGKPKSRIISIAQMAQSVMAVVLQRPNDARARPSSLLKDSEDYAKVFSSAFPIGLFLVCGRLFKRVEDFLKSRDMAQRDRNNLRFYLAMYVSAVAASTAVPSAEKISAIDIDAITDDTFEQSFQVIQDAYVSLGGNDQVAKGRELPDTVREMLTNVL